MSLLNKLRQDFPGVQFVESDEPKWSPETKTVYFDPSLSNADWSLLHEAGHMLSNHTSYSTDIELLQMELEAWQKAQELSSKYGASIDKSHIEDCLDSYRDWLYKRSLCPTCAQTGIEKTSGNYSCINCGANWQVTRERFCRVYRKTKAPA